ncbi:hypothetical protein HMPREF0666_00606 [Prevotella sp. C561]|nr:hypothetical protein HMPREF0666_00606 [Prevotella sp. C561]
MIKATNAVIHIHLSRSYAEFCTQAEAKENNEDCLKDCKNVD